MTDQIKVLHASVQEDMVTITVAVPLPAKATKPMSDSTALIELADEAAAALRALIAAAKVDRAEIERLKAELARLKADAQESKP